LSQGYAKDPRMLHSMPTVFPILLQGMLHGQPGDHDNPSAIAPGLTIEGAVRAILNYIAADYYEVKLGVLASLTTSLGETAKKTIAWEAFSVLRRSKLAVLIFRHYIRRDIHKRQQLYDVCRGLACFVMGWEIDKSLWLKVVKESIRQSTPGEAPKFQHWLGVELQKILPRVQLWLRLFDVALPSEVELLICEFAYV
jgi:hypothetical protein